MQNRQPQCTHGTSRGHDGDEETEERETRGSDIYRLRAFEVTCRNLSDADGPVVGAHVWVRVGS